MKKFGLIFGGVLGGLVPVLALAFHIPGSGPHGAGTQDVTGVLKTIQGILNTVIPILITLGVIYFIWGVIQYVSAKDEEKQKEARSTMIYGIIGLFVIVAIWGLVGLLSTTFDIGTGGGPTQGLPTVTP